MVSKALESNSYTLASGTGAAFINPELWVRSIEEFAKAKIVMAPLGRAYNDLVGQAGGSLNIQFNDEISASAVAEATAITPSSFGYTQVVFTPSEIAVAVAITRKERIRSIQDIMAEKTRDMGYALAKKKDSTIIAALVAGAGTQVTANGTDVGSITLSDTLDNADIADAITAIRVNDYQARYIVIHPKQENSLIKLSDFIDASIYGGREVVMNGEIGKYLGLRVLVTTQIPQNTTTATAYDGLVLDQDAFGIAYKMGITFNSDYKVLEREFILAAVEEYDVKVLRAEKIVTLTSYGG